MVGLSSSDKPSQDGPGPTPENMCRPGCVGAPRRVFVVYAVAQYSVESPEVKRATETESIRRRVQCTDSIFYRNVTNSIISCPATHSQAIRDRERLKSKSGAGSAIPQLGLVCASGPAWLGRCSARVRCPVRLGAGGSLHTGKRSTFTCNTTQAAHNNTVLIRSRRERALWHASCHRLNHQSIIVVPPELLL